MFRTANALIVAMSKGFARFKYVIIESCIGWYWYGPSPYDYPNMLSRPYTIYT